MTQGIWTLAAFVLVGLLSGAFSGLIGIGGGIIIIPILVYFFGMIQKLAQGTTLALMLPPIGIMAAYVYYKSGFVDIKAAAFIAIGFIVGGWLGAKFAVHIPQAILSKVFAVFLLAVSIKMLLTK
jgi:uncharacterized membrane protein YfcA